MSKSINPPKKHKYGQQPPKKKPPISIDFAKYKKPIIITVSILLAALIIAGAITFIIDCVTIDTPYDGIRIPKYIRIPEYKGMELKEEDITKSFEDRKKALLRKYATFTELTEGVIKEDNNVTIDAKGYIIENGVKADKPFENGTLENYEITSLGSHTTSSGALFAKEIQDALIGKDVTTKDVIHVQLTYPADATAEAMRGKTVEFDITIKKVTETQYPEYTNEFIFAKTDYKTIEEYEEALDKDIRINILWNRLITNSVVISYPKSKMSQYTTEFDDYYKAYMQSQNISFDKLLSDVLGTNNDGYIAQRFEYAQETIKEEMILYFIVKTEDIRLSDEEFNALALEIAEQNGYKTVEELKATTSDEVFERTVIWEKVKRLIYDWADKIPATPAD